MSREINVTIRVNQELWSDASVLARQRGERVEVWAADVIKNAVAEYRFHEHTSAPRAAAAPRPKGA